MKAPVLAIAMGKPRGESMASKDEGSDEADERDAFDAFADDAGIPDDKRDSAYDALVAMIQACIAREKSGGYDEED